MELYKPIINEDRAFTNVTVQEPSKTDTSSDAIYMLGQSIAKALSQFGGERLAVESPEVVQQPQTEAATTPQPTQINDTGRVNDGRVQTVTDTALPLEAKAFLDTISRYESRGYNIIVGEGRYGAPATFSDFTKHPNVIGMRTVAGPSTAAGRYQFVYKTWKALQQQYPGQFTDFTPVTQDRAAWRYAQDVFKQRTGQDLLSTLREGRVDIAKNALKNIWIGFGLDPNVMGTYNQAFKRYTS